MSATLLYWVRPSSSASLESSLAKLYTHSSYRSDYFLSDAPPKVLITEYITQIIYIYLAGIISAVHGATVACILVLVLQYSVPIVTLSWLCYKSFIDDWTDLSLGLTKPSHPVWTRFIINTCPFGHLNNYYMYLDVANIVCIAYLEIVEAKNVECILLVKANKCHVQIIVRAHFPS